MSIISLVVPYGGIILNEWVSTSCPCRAIWATLCSVCECQHHVSIVPYGQHCAQKWVSVSCRLRCLMGYITLGWRMSVTSLCRAVWSRFRSVGGCQHLVCRALGATLRSEVSVNIKSFLCHIGDKTLSWRVLASCLCPAACSSSRSVGECQYHVFAVPCGQQCAQCLCLRLILVLVYVCMYVCNITLSE